MKTELAQNHCNFFSGRIWNFVIFISLFVNEVKKLSILLGAARDFVRARQRILCRDGKWERTWASETMMNFKQTNKKKLGKWMLQWTSIGEWILTILRGKLYCGAPHIPVLYWHCISQQKSGENFGKFVTMRYIVEVKRREFLRKIEKRVCYNCIRSHFFPLSWKWNAIKIDRILSWKKKKRKQSASLMWTIYVNNYYAIVHTSLIFLFFLQSTFFFLFLIII